MAESNDAELRTVALTEAVKFGAFRAAHGSSVPGTGIVLAAAEAFLKFLKGEPLAGEGAAD